jgi:hypothetical protein
MNEMQRKQAEFDRTPVQLVDAYEVANVTFTTPGGETINAVDVMVTLLSGGRKQTKHRIRLGPKAATALADDLRAAALRAQGKPPVTH